MYYLLIAMFFACFGLIAYTVGSILWPYRSALTEQIGFFENSWQQAHAEIADAGADNRGDGLKAKLKRHLVRWLGSRGPVDYLKTGLDKSGLSLEWSEFTFYHLLGTAVFGALSFLVGGWVAAMGALFLGAWSPILVLNVLISKRGAAFSNQLPDTLSMLAGSLKAGYSLPQAVDIVSRECADPMAAEFRRVLTDARLGLPVEDSLEKMAARMQNTSFEWMVLAVKIQREVGGNLVELLNNLARTIRERETVRRQIKVLTAEGRLSAIILLALPVFVSGLLFLLNPEYMGLLFNNSMGLSLLAFAIFMMIIGALWLRRVVKIEV